MHTGFQRNQGPHILNKLPLQFACALACGALLLSVSALSSASFSAGANTRPTFYRTFRPASSNGFASAQAEDVIATRDGGVLGIGRNSVTDAAHPGVPNHLGWLIKLGPNGGRQWERSYFINASDPGITQSVSLHAAAQLPDDGFIALGGVTQQRGVLWLLRTDAAGAPQSLRRIGLGGNFQPIGIVAAANDGALVFARVVGTDNSRPSYSSLLVRVNNAGAVVWQRQLGPASGNLVRDAIALPDGGFLVAGIHTPQGAVSPWKMQSLLARLDANGGIVWQKSLAHETSNVTVDRLVAMPDGSYMAAIDAGFQFAFARLAADGTLLSTKTYLPDRGTNDYLEVRTVDFFRQTNDTLVALIESVGVRSISGAPMPSYSYSSHIVKIDTSGSELWHKSISDTVLLRGMAPFGDGQLAVGSMLAASTASVLATDSSGAVDNTCSVPTDGSYPEVVLSYTTATIAVESAASALNVAEVSVTSVDPNSVETAVCVGVIPPPPTTDPRLTRKTYVPVVRR